MAAKKGKGSSSGNKTERVGNFKGVTKFAPPAMKGGKKISSKKSK